MWHFWGGGGNTGMSGQLTRPDTQEDAGRSFRFACQDVTLLVSERQQKMSDLSTDLTGDLVWPTAVAFCKYLCDRRELVQGSRVCDLGAGTGLVGLVASRLGASQVTLTDVPRVLPLLSRNAALACVPDAEKKEVDKGQNVSVRALFWGAAEAEDFVREEGLFDLVICCEVVYQQPQQVWEALQATLRRLLRPGGRAVFAYQHRDGAEITDAHFFDTLEQNAGLRFQSQESLADWDGAWEEMDFRWVRQARSRVEPEAGAR
ncbi:unnamed protein product [Effrenium voratum]|nr:unnamed protein product [Effrenium voratum]